ncbi:MAG: HEAT repeat domain-containing protein [Kiritimatiellae bacterium]|nr:HEAT repeat domain-containing protein [Kiritimatiellia bacterium]
MPKRQTFDAKLAALRELEDTPLSEHVLRELRKALAGANNVLAAKAAQIAGRREWRELIEDMAQAFERFMTDPVRTDKGCHAKNAIVEALNELDCMDHAVFLRGVRHVQMEPAFGRPVDTADNLRGNCGIALVRTGCPDAATELTTLLADPEPQARRAAVKGLTLLAGPESELLLRFKCLTGDTEPDVIGECLAGLIAFAPDRSMAFVAGFLKADDSALAQDAALALGNSRTAEAWHILRRRREDSIDPDFKNMLLLPIALTRQAEALAYLLALVKDAHPDDACAAVEALKIYEEDDTLRERVQTAVDGRDEAAVKEAWRDGRMDDSTGGPPAPLERGRPE